MEESNKTIEICIGDTAFIEKTFSYEDAFLYGEISLDRNPIHIDEDFAAKSRFGKRIIQGILVAALISAAIGTKLPGFGSIYLAQDLKFLHPVYIGDHVRATVTVIEIVHEKNIYRLETICTNQKGEKVIEGIATILLQKNNVV